MTEQGPTPLRREGRGYRFVCDPGATLCCGRTFDSECGYMVVLMFEGAADCNVVTPDDAKAVAAGLRADDPEDAEFSDIVQRMAAICEMYNIAWAAAGHPLDGVTEGRA